MWNIMTAKILDNPSPERCFISITLVASKTRQIMQFIPSLQIQEICIMFLSNTNINLT